MAFLLSPSEEHSDATKVGVDRHRDVPSASSIEMHSTRAGMDSQAPSKARPIPHDDCGSDVLAVPAFLNKLLGELHSFSSKAKAQFANLWQSQRL
jgi:hypothetical protein